MRYRKLQLTLIFVLLCFGTGKAIPLAEYRRNVEQSIETLAHAGNEEQADLPQSLNSVRTWLPLRLQVEWHETAYLVNNTWLHQLLGEIEKVGESERSKLLARARERLSAVNERLIEIERNEPAATSKDATRKKLEAILARPEYAKKPAEPSALLRLWNEFLRWLSSLFGPPKAVQPGSALAISKAAQVFVVVLALAVIIYVVWMFAPKFRRVRRVQKTRKQQPRIVLGEYLEPDQSAVDLLSEAEALARQGEIRAAIRKAYIALLVELGDRKIISLARHKTNRDYLRALREQESLHLKMVQLTESFERHWYGSVQAKETDWAEFRTRSQEVLQQ